MNARARLVVDDNAGWVAIRLAYNAAENSNKIATLMNDIAPRLEMTAGAHP